MGMRIHKKWDFLIEQSGALVLLLTIYLLGGLAGCLFVALSNGAGAKELSGYLADYLTLAGGGRLPRELWPVLWNQLRYPLSVLVLSLTGFGIVGVPVLIGIRGFFFAFPVACFCRTFGGSGLFPAFILFGLPALLWTPALFILGVSGFLAAQRQFRRSAGEGRGNLYLAGPYWYRIGLCFGLSLTAGLLEFWVVPVLLRAVAHVVL